MAHFEGIALVKFTNGTTAFGFAKGDEDGEIQVTGVHGTIKGVAFEVIPDHRLSNGEQENAMRRDYDAWQAPQA